MKKKLFTEIPYIQGDRVVLRKVTQDDADALKAMTESKAVYRYLPTFLFEQKYDDIHYVIDHLYDECFKESIILGVYIDGEFAGLAELYGYKEKMHHVCIGCRLIEKFWGQGICTEVVGLLVKYLYEETDIEIITASTMIENKGSAGAVRKNGFDLVVHAAEEDWGYDGPTLADKWIR